jgi:glutamate dehydrogenase (NAD(P)+)
VVDFAGAGKHRRRVVLEVDCDILIPAAEQQITAANAGDHMVIEGGQWSVLHAGGRRHFAEQHPVPFNVIANAGGVTVITVLNGCRTSPAFFWDEDEINARLVKIMRTAFAGICRWRRKRVVCARPIFIGSRAHPVHP